MGLSVAWSSMDLGAKEPQQVGHTFFWGVTEVSKKKYKEPGWWDYKLCWITYGIKFQYTVERTNKYLEENELFFGLTKYNKSDWKYTLEEEDDAAFKKLGPDWRIPSKEEWEELKDTSNCNWAPTFVKDVLCYKVTSKITGNSIYLPFEEKKENLMYDPKWDTWTNVTVNGNNCYKISTHVREKELVNIEPERIKEFSSHIYWTKDRSNLLNAYSFRMYIRYMKDNNGILHPMEENWIHTSTHINRKEDTWQEDRRYNEYAIRPVSRTIQKKMDDERLKNWYSGNENALMACLDKKDYAKASEYAQILSKRPPINILRPNQSASYYDYTSLKEAFLHSIESKDYSQASVYKQYLRKVNVKNSWFLVETDMGENKNLVEYIFSHREDKDDITLAEETGKNSFTHFVAKKKYSQAYEVFQHLPDIGVSNTWILNDLNGGKNANLVDFIINYSEDNDLIQETIQRVVDEVENDKLIIDPYSYLPRLYENCPTVEDFLVLSAFVEAKNNHVNIVKDQIFKIKDSLVHFDYHSEGNNWMLKWKNKTLASNNSLPRTNALLVRLLCISILNDIGKLDHSFITSSMESVSPSELSNNLAMVDNLMLGLDNNSPNYKLTKAISDYTKGCLNMNAGMYDDAIKSFKACIKYGDSKEKIKECKAKK